MTKEFLVPRTIAEALQGNGKIYASTHAWSGYGMFSDTSGNE